MFRAAAVSALASIFLIACGAPNSQSSPAEAPQQPTPVATGAASVRSTGEITYGDDGFKAATCGDSSQLHYEVFYPSSPGPHPIVFGMQGTGFAGSAGCAKGGLAAYRGFDRIMSTWAEAGFVAVNIEYHGFSNGLFGDQTYPGVGRWGAAADATVELDIKPAMQFFLTHNPAQYGAAESSGVVVFGSSSGAHNAYMVGVTGLEGHRIAAVVGWSGLPDVADSGSYPESVFDRYMRTSPGTDVEHFGDPAHRLGSSGPAQYIANGLTEFISPTNAEQYAALCQSQTHAACWLRVANTAAHAAGYAGYTFTDKSPELSDPKAQIGVTVEQDSISFAQQHL